MRVPITLTEEQVLQYDVENPLALIEYALREACGLDLGIIHTQIGGWKIARRCQNCWYPLPATYEPICRSYLFHRKAIEFSHIIGDLPGALFWPIMDGKYMGDDGVARDYGDHTYTYQQHGDDVLVIDHGVTSPDRKYIGYGLEESFTITPQGLVKTYTSVDGKVIKEEDLPRDTE